MVGLSSGLGLWIHALVLTAFIAVLMLILNRVQFGMWHQFTNVYRINVSASRSALDPETIDAIKEKTGSDRLLNVLWTSKKSAKIQFIKPLTISTEINTIHYHIVGVVGEAKSLTI